MIAQQNFKLRLRVPERHARFLKAGDKIRVDGAEFGDQSPKSGMIDLVYPQIEDGRVIADATVENLGEYFVGDRLRVWISGGERKAFVIPPDLRHHALRHRLRPDPRGQSHRQRAGAARAESGRAPIFPAASKSCPASAPVTSWCSLNLGLSGRLTRAFITSPLTPLFLLAALAFGIVALISLPREEEPQISVPMVDIHVSADGLQADGRGRSSSPSRSRRSSRASTASSTSIARPRTTA